MCIEHREHRKHIESSNGLMIHRLIITNDYIVLSRSRYNLIP